MRRLLLLTLLAAIPAVAHDHGSRGNHHSTSMTFDDHDDTAVTCNDLDVTFDGQRAQITTENVAVRGNSLRVISNQNGGIRVLGAEDGNWNVQACKAVAPGSNGSARVSYNGSELSADTSEDDAMVYFIIRAPRGVSIDAVSNNGPIAFHGVDGTITARATNGPVSVKESNGTIDASTVNGPIAFSGGSGKVKLSAENGPLAVKLDGASWNGSLDASTENGPVSVRLPRNFGSRVVVQATGHGPISCRADACGDRKGTRILDDDDDDRGRSRRFEFGTGAETVHITAGNGPLTIRDRE